MTEQPLDLQKEIDLAREILRECNESEDTEVAHILADRCLVRLLRAYRRPEDILDAYNEVEKWYA